MVMNFLSVTKLGWASKPSVEAITKGARACALSKFPTILKVPSHE